MAEPKTREEMESTPFFKAGARAKASGRKLTEAISCLRPGCWQYDAFITGYDAPKSVKQGSASPNVLNAILNLTPLTLVEVASRRLIREAAQWARMHSTPVEQPYWFYQGLHTDGSLLVAAPSGHTERIDALDVMAIIPAEPIRTKAMPPVHFLEWQKAQRSGARAVPHELYAPGSVLGATRDRWGRFEYRVLFDDPALNTSSTWLAPLPDDERKQLYALTKRTRMPVSSKSASNWSADSEAKKIERRNRKACSAFFSLCLADRNSRKT